MHQESIHSTGIVQIQQAVSKQSVRFILHATDNVSHSLRANKIVPVRPVRVCYSSASLALLQFVTNTLLAERVPGIHIQTTLTRHEDLEVKARNRVWTNQRNLRRCAQPRS